MKKFLLSLAVVLGTISIANAQLQKGNWMVGGSLGNIVLEKNHVGLNLNPKAGYFIADNIVVGATVPFSLDKYKGADVTADFNVKAFGRYFFNNQFTDAITKTGKFFVEADGGFASLKKSSGNTGFGFSFGPGYTYFVNESVAVDIAAKFSGVVGESFHPGVTINFGFQIYLPTSTVKKAIKM